MKIQPLLGCLLLAAAPGAIASTIAYDYPIFNNVGGTPNPGNQNYSQALGMDFRVNAGNSIIVSQLGAFYSGLPTIDPNTILTVQLYSQANKATPLATAVFNTATPGTLTNGEYLQNIAPLTLLSGAYTIVAYGYNGTQQNGNRGNGGLFNPAVQNSGGVLTFDSSSPYGGGVGTYPNTPFGGADYFGAGTFAFTPLASTVPEPGSLLLFAAGIVALLIRRPSQRSAKI